MSNLTRLPVMRGTEPYHYLSTNGQVGPDLEPIATVSLMASFVIVGKKGIGLSKRAPSPDASERLAKMAKMAESREHQDFRTRARQEYEERRAEGRLGPAQRTCTTLDEKAGREVRTGN